MKNKVLVVLVICTLGLFFDDLAMRLAHLEYSQNETRSNQDRITKLEEQNQQLIILEERWLRSEAKIRLVAPLAAKLNVLQQQFVIHDQILRISLNKNMNLKIFKTAQDVFTTVDTTIGSYVTHQLEGWGAKPELEIGSHAPENINRVLMKFLQLKPGLMKGKQIFAAVLYLKQTQSDSLHDDDGALQETINLYAVRKQWDSGDQIRGQASQGVANWISARAQEQDWAIPGCGSETEDYDPEVLATTGPTVYGDATEWVPIIFTTKGLERLQSWLEGSLDYQGFLLKLTDENRSMAIVSFNSSNVRNKLDRPYLEIYYLDGKVKER